MARKVTELHLHLHHTDEAATDGLWEQVALVMLMHASG